MIVARTKLVYNYLLIVGVLITGEEGNEDTARNTKRENRVVGLREGNKRAREGE